MGDMNHCLFHLGIYQIDVNELKIVYFCLTELIQWAMGTRQFSNEIKMIRYIFISCVVTLNILPFESIDNHCLPSSKKYEPKIPNLVTYAHQLQILHTSYIWTLQSTHMKLLEI